jgi:hypothetical protein
MTRTERRPQQDVIGRIMAANGGNLPRLPVTCPWGVPSMEITREVVSHIVKAGDLGHIAYAPFLREVLEDPMEVWDRTVGGKPNQIHFLRKFTQGRDEITLMAVGDQYESFLRTGFRLSGAKQAQKKRAGMLLYAKWA